ncbi:MAG: GNAT family N-acetyltransferase, partial [Clostridiales bacterium]|nr:GNAT family N-acetyltransferase [Clostridiales bacterium]
MPITLQIRKAAPEDYSLVRELYYQITDEMEHSEFSPGWVRDVYPSQNFLRESIQHEELYIGMAENRVVSAMVINHEGNDSYQNAHWRVCAKKEEIVVIHALGVLPSCSGAGCAKQMTRYVIELARKKAMKAIRLDVLHGNLPAVKSYTKVGFAY